MGRTWPGRKIPAFFFRKAVLGMTFRFAIGRHHLDVAAQIRDHGDRRQVQIRRCRRHHRPSKSDVPYVDPKLYRVRRGDSGSGYHKQIVKFPQTGRRSRVHPFRPHAPAQERSKQICLNQSIAGFDAIAD